MKLTIGSTVLFALLTPATHAQREWPQFRGPGGRCVAKGAAIPTDFGPESRVLWSAEVPGGHSSPCIDRELLVLTGSPSPSTDVVLAVDRTDGSERWRRTFEHDAGDARYFHADGGPALTTACTDGKRFVVYLAGYGLVALDRDGETLWEVRLSYPRYMFGVGPSPLIVDDVVVLPRDGSPEAAILAFDLEDGSERWRVDRFEYVESHGTPFLWSNNDRDELIVAGTGRLVSLDPTNGETLWSYEGITIFPCTTPTADADTLYFAAWSTGNASGRSLWEAGFGRSLELSDEEVEDPSLLFRRLDADGDGQIVPDEVPECRAKDAFGFLDRDRSGTWSVEELEVTPQQAPGENIMIAVPRGLSGELSAEDLAWSRTRGLPYVSSPLLHRGRIWLFKAGGIVTCLDAATGEPVVDRARLSDRAEYYLSPVGAGDVVLAGSAEGTLYLIDATADELDVLHTVDFGDELFATPAVVDGTVYVRSKTRLWAFGADSGS